MKIHLLFVIFFFAGPIISRGQAQADASPPPVDKFSIQPRRANWIEKSTAASSTEDGKRIVEIETRVFDGTEYSEIRYSDGTKTRVWKSGTIAVTVELIRGREEVAIEDFRNNPTAMRLGTKFPRLEWIRAENFRGVVERGSLRCWHFSDEKVSSPEELPPYLRDDNLKFSQKREAWIDTKSGLPVARSDDGNEVVYIFQEEPAIPSPMPSQVKNAVEKYQKGMLRYFPDKKGE